ncbi:hypothetical protein [Vibrio sp. SCSIO 43136]|nr:hypothetical protein [Vibrio sp. SCSIO 43136]USD64215.1 hypothetical protein J4N39_08835 [Vibrio sp. SCSIO 43136]
MDRMSVFIYADNQEGHVQAVIKVVDFEHYEKLGFVDDVTKVTKPKK